LGLAPELIVGFQITVQEFVQWPIGSLAAFITVTSSVAHGAFLQTSAGFLAMPALALPFLSKNVGERNIVVICCFQIHPALHVSSNK